MISSMSRVPFAPIAIFSLAAVVSSNAQSAKPLTAPTYYIAASGEFNKYSTTLDVKGASNLPPGSRLYVTLSDYVGYRSSILSEDAFVVTGKGGLFTVTLKPSQGVQLKDNMVCDISFQPHGLPQPPSVLKIVGEHGENLGIENNPQVHKNSGDNYYLEALVHIP